MINAAGILMLIVIHTSIINGLNHRYCNCHFIVCRHTLICANYTVTLLAGLTKDHVWINPNQLISGSDFQEIGPDDG